MNSNVIVGVLRDGRVTLGIQVPGQLLLSSLPMSAAFALQIADTLTSAAKDGQMLARAFRRKIKQVLNAPPRANPKPKKTKMKKPAKAQRPAMARGFGAPR